jgi:hypothetical protein
MKHHVILGRDRRDVEAQRDMWLTENPDIRVVRVHPPKAEPLTLLTRIGGRNVPRISVEFEYEISNKA